MQEGYFGLEKESLRINTEGFLSHTSHPFGNNQNIERDFCENQTELITGVCDSVESVWNQLAALHKKAVKTLLALETGKEWLWPFSNPPYVKGENDIPIATYEGRLKGKERYRQYLAQKYGKKKMLFSGIHFNFSFSDTILRAGYAESTCSSYWEYKNRVYIELAKKVTRYSWLIVYLMAASPVMDGSYFKDDSLGIDVHKNYASPRCSEIGYWNDFIPLLEYDNLEAYVQSIQNYVDEGSLKASAELYYPVRLKPAGENSLEALRLKGVNHIELRMLDLNPLTPVGIMKEDLKFIHLFLLYLMALDDTEFESLDQVMAIKNEKRAAGYDENDIWIETGWNQSLLIKDAALQILSDMEEFYQKFDVSCRLDMIHYQREKVLDPEKRYAVRIRREFGKGYVKKGLVLAEKYAKEIDEE